MQVGCTKKLLDYIGVKAGPANTNADPMLSWTANSITINHRRAIVVCNDSSRYGFVLYGVKNKDIHNLETLLFDGVRACLNAELIAPELIETFIADCGSGVTFTKTANRSVVGRLNQLCVRVFFMADVLTTEDLLQKQLIPALNNDLVTTRNDPKENYFFVYDKFADDISQRYGAHPYRCKAAEFAVELELESPCRRHIIVPLDYTFRQFHSVLQSLFCWQGHHLHDFWIERYPNGRLKHTLVGFPRQDVYEGETTQPDGAVCLSEIFPRYEHIIYNYDFGDDWIHHIRLVGIIDDFDKNHAVCLGGEGDAPPEDVGGAHGYAQLLQILADPEDSEHNEMKAWYESMPCEPFNLDRINRKLQSCIRYSSGL